MTDELKFYDPETGAELHRVPEGVTIPAETPYGYIYSGSRVWFYWGSTADIRQIDGVPRFTREPIAPPKPPLPTEPGSTIRAVHQSGDECAVMVRGKSGKWHGVDQYGDERFWGDESVVSWEPVAIVPTETWDRLRVIDPEDKRDRVDRDGVFVRHSAIAGDLWAWNLTWTHRHFGPLRFADEVSDR